MEAGSANALGCEDTIGNAWWTRIPLTHHLLKAHEALEHSMKISRTLMIAALLLGAALPTWAGEFTVIKEEIKTARQALVSMVLYREKRGPEQQKLVKDTADLVSEHLRKVSAPAKKAAEVKELKETWAAFKKTREEELVPAIMRNDRARYEKVAGGIQKERLDRMYALIDSIEG